MSRESDNGFVCPRCDTTIYLEQCACPDWADEVVKAQTPSPLPTWGAALPAFPSPLLAKHKLDVSWEDLS